ncbi:hypothetical protein BCR34DRAFT_468604, partial [Clohesyomyces aquaticus]
SLPPETLPPEIWMMIILSLDDHCFAWFVLRRVSPFLRSVTESVFAQRIIKDIAIRFAGNGAKNVIVDHVVKQVYLTTQRLRDARKDHFQTLFGTQHPTFYFEATRFSPPDTKEKVILKLREPLNSYQNSAIVVEVSEVAARRTTRYPFAWFLRKACCSCDPEKCGWLKSSHFVRVGGALRSARLPSIELIEETREISLDWRLFCQRFYYDELLSR